MSVKNRFDYHKKNFENPFYRKQKKVTIGIGLKIKIIGSILIAIFLTLAWFFTFSSFWKIKEINITGLERMSSQEIIDRVKEKTNKRILFVFPGSNSLLFNQDKFALELNDRYHFETISVKKDLPKTLNINAEAPNRDASVGLLIFS